MENIWQRIVEHLFGRLDGPLHFRFIFQPLMAVIFAIIDGVKDAKNGKPAYFWAVIVDPGHRKELLKDGWKHVGKIFIIAVILDIVYQLSPSLDLSGRIAYRGLYPGDRAVCCAARPG